MSAITSGAAHMCALTTTGGVECWGWNYYGQIGVGTDTGPNVCGSGDENYPIGCAIFPAAVRGLGSGVTAITAGYASTYALTSAGGVMSWGYNGVGALGDGITKGPEECGQFPVGCATVPVPVSGLGSGVAAIGAGYDHACALLETGGVECWGIDSDGELGDGTTTTSRTPVAVQLPAGVTVTALASGGGYHTCALTSTGEVLCWGYNDWGELGDGTDSGPQTCGAAETPCATTPVAAQLPVGVTATAVTTGAEFSCALTSEGGVLCWGIGADGELGDGTTASDSPTPVAVQLPAGVTITAISSMEGQTCALTSTGEVLCWGEGNPTPVAITGLEGPATAVAAGGEYACALIATGGVECWGFSRNGALGDGYRENPTPEPVIGLNWSLSVSTSGAGAGTVSSTPAGIDCGGSGHTSCGGLFAPGSTVLLRASPDSGSAFVGFTGGGCGAAGSTCQVPMGEEQSVSATFALAPSASIAAPGEGGTYTEGESVPTSFSCAEGESGPGLSSCKDSNGTSTAAGGAGHLDTSTPGNHTYTVTATSGDGGKGTASITYTVEPSLSPPPPSATYTLTISVAGDGAGSVTDNTGSIDCPTGCSHSYLAGSQVTLTASPENGSTFTGWSGGDCSGTGSCRITVATDETVTADFRAAPPSGTKITRAKIDSGKGSATFAFEAIGAPTHFQCRLKRPGGRAKFEACSSPRTFRHLKPGRYVFSVRAIGPGGVDVTAARRRFRIGR